MTSRTIHYNHTMRLGEITVGVGTVTAACVRREADGGIKAVELPPAILSRLRGVSGT